MKNENDSDSPDRFIEENEDFIHNYLISHQSDLKAYILSAIGNYSSAMDVLQQTNVVLLRKASEFKRSEKFLPWAFAVARFEILGYIRNLQRSRLVFTPEVVDLLCEPNPNEMNEDLSDRRMALHECLELLDDKSKTLLEHRYTREFSIQQIAEETNRTNRAIGSAIARLRHGLGECIQRKLSKTT